MRTRSAPLSSAALRICDSRAGCAETTAGRSALRRFAPVARTCLRVKINNRGRAPCLLCSNSHRKGQGGFPRTAFLSNNRDNVHTLGE